MQPTFEGLLGTHVVGTGETRLQDTCGGLGFLGWWSVNFGHREFIPFFVCSCLPYPSCTDGRALLLGERATEATAGSHSWEAPGLGKPGCGKRVGGGDQRDDRGGGGSAGWASPSSTPKARAMQGVTLSPAGEEAPFRLGGSGTPYATGPAATQAPQPCLDLPRP